MTMTADELAKRVNRRLLQDQSEDQNNPHTALNTLLKAWGVVGRGKPGRRWEQVMCSPGNADPDNPFV